jgi:hypothetical protein
MRISFHSNIEISRHAGDLRNSCKECMQRRRSPGRFRCMYPRHRTQGVTQRMPQRLLAVTHVGWGGGQDRGGAGVGIDLG